MWARNLGLSFAFAALIFIVSAFIFVAFGLVDLESLSGLINEIKSLEGLLTFISFCLLVSTTSIGYHRLVVMEKNLEETKSNNNFTNYFKHRELFFALCESLEQKYEITIESNELYRKIFPESSKKHAIGKTDSKVLERPRTERKVYQSFFELEESSFRGYNLLRGICRTHTNYLKLLNISTCSRSVELPYFNKKGTKIASESFPIIGGNLVEFLLNINEIHRKIAHFAELEEPELDNHELDYTYSIDDEYIATSHIKRGNVQVK